MKKYISIFLVVLVVMSLFTVSVSAAGSDFAPYKSYEYNEFGEAIVAPTGYTYKQSITGSALGLGSEFSLPSDIVTYDGHIYILDSNNNRIIELDGDYNTVKVYADFKISNELAEKYQATNDNGTITFAGASGFDITPSGEFVIADTPGNRVLKIDRDCNVNLVILRPDDALNDTDALFAPKKVKSDDKGRLYITSDNIALGAMVFSADGDFVEFYGANEVLSTTQALLKFFRKTFMNITQLELVESTVPVTIQNMDFAENGFAYTVSPYRDSNSKSAVSGLVRKLNYSGENLTDSEVIFGDTIDSESGRKTWFHDIDVDSQGFLNILDNSRGRVFQYTDTGTLLTVFGANSDQAGCFTSATAIETINDDILVVDNKKNSVLVFTATDYIKNLRAAVVKMNNNDFEGSADIYNELLKSNSNSYLCYQGLGRIADYKGDYEQAMEYYELAYDQEGYALSFKEQRQIDIENNAVWVLLGIVAVIVAIAIGIKYLKKLAVPVEGSAYSRMESKKGMPFYVLLHPIDGFSQFKARKLPSLGISAIIAVAWFVIKTLDFSVTGFAFSINRSVDFNLPVTMLLTIGIYVMFCVCNWAICTLIEGKGTIVDIFATVSYSLIPYLVSLVLKMVLTNFLVPSEQVFISIITTIGLIWTAGILILGLLTIHDFTVSKTLWSIILTLLGMVAMVFLCILLYSLMNQMFSFFESVYKEFTFRIK